MGSHQPFLADGGPAEPDHIEAAARWMARLLADDVSDQDRLACQQWRAADPRHEQAWQRMCRVSGKFASIPAGTEILESARKAVVSRRQFLNLSLLAVVGAGAWLAAPHARVGAGLLAQYRTGVGESQTYTLKDGTRLTLNTDTAVDVSFSSGERRIRLHEGEILVSTGQESPRRRFVVQTRFGELEALGTEFSVRQYPDHARVAVLEGAVRAQSGSGGGSQRIVPGQQARVDGLRVDAPSPMPASAVSWRQGKLVAEGMRVADFVEEIARYRPGFTLCDDAVAEMTISGVFTLADTDRALQSLAGSLPVALKYHTDYWVKVIPAH
ncbi:MAG: FecR domain-containing protein [Marinobacter sp.]|uniref:FecR domain-containing protein n=1 Tax=Marinobacter sp. TaxID=50741 RepID=UPI00299E47A1|nr:FecR domain-containing protein [Marinobacter sp.]MDX1635199.1 FecR domain-containing protein [Marinobacter sp.]